MKAFIYCLFVASQEVIHNFMYWTNRDYFDYYNRTDKKYYEN